MKKNKILFCALTSLLVFVISSCDTSSSSNDAALQYNDILKNGLGLSESETVERYQIDESSVQKEERDSEEIWTLSEPEEIMGQPATVFLNFEDDSLTGASFVISIDNDEQQTWQTLMDVYDDMLETLGEPSSNWTSQQPFGRFEDYTDFQKTVTPLLETEGMYTESNNWLLSEQTDSDGADANRAQLSLSMFESGNSTIEQWVYLP